MDADIQTGRPVLPSDVQQVVVVKEETSDDPSLDVDQQQPEALHIKAEPDQQFSFRETKVARFTFSTVSTKCEDDEDKGLFLQLHQHLKEGQHLRASTSADRMEIQTDEKDCGEAKSINPDLYSYNNPEKEQVPKENNPSVDPQVPELVHIKQEEEEPWISRGGKQLSLKEETDPSIYPITVVLMKSDDDEDKPLFSQPHHHQAEGVFDPPTSCSADQMKAETDEEDFGGSDLSPHEDTFSSSETEVSDDDDDDDASPLDTKLQQMSKSGSETDDSQNDGKESRTPELGDNTVNNSLSCSECDQQFGNKRSLQRHIIGHSSAKPSRRSLNKKHARRKKNINALKKDLTDVKCFTCDDCGKSFSWKNHLSRHMRIHTGEKPFSCDICGQRFNQNSNLNKHMRIHTGGKPFGCDVCGQRFNLKSYLHIHMRIHTGEKPFACDVCGQRFNQKSNLNKHAKIHTGGKPYGCDFCGQRFNLKSYLSKHIRIHTGEKPFRCDVCNQRFNLKSHLNLHKIIHTGAKPFACDVCGQRLTHKSALKKHMKIHLEVKSFDCDVCGRRFNQKSALKRHLRIHTGDKPFGCDICGQRFNQKAHLSKHMTTHTGAKPFGCDVCGQIFNLKSLLIRHANVHTDGKSVISV